MKRFGFTAYGQPDVFTTIEADVPEPKPGQVQIEVLGFALNPYDASLRRGEQAEFRKLDFPIVPGTDVLGRVTALGDGVTDFSVGDLVINYRPIGAYSDYVVASTSKVIKKPTALSFLDATALPQVGIAAYTIMQNLLNLPEGSTVAVLGANGGIGSLVVQIAGYLHLKVLALASQQDDHEAELLGADAVGTYTDFPASYKHQAEAVINTVFGGDDHGLSDQLVKSGGIVIRTAYSKPLALETRNVTQMQLGELPLAKPEAAFPFLTKMAKTYGLTVRVAQVLPFTLEGVIEGHRLLETHHAPGKLIVLREKKELKPVRKDVNHL